MFFNKSTLQSSLSGLVGADQTVNPEYSSLLPSLLASRSGYYWNREHSLLTIENIDQSIKNYSEFNYTAFSTSTRDAGGYSAGSKVSYSGSNYEYIASTVSTSSTPNPGADANVWREIDELNDYIIKIDYQSSMDVLNSVFNNKKVSGQVKSLFNHRMLFSGQANKSDTVTNEGAFVGIRITLADQRSLALVLHKLGHQFNDTVSDLDVYLYHTSQQTALTTFTVNHTTANSSQWTDLSDYVIRWLSDNHDIGGSFLLGYFQDDLSTTQAIQKQIVWNTYSSCCDVKKDYKEYKPFATVTGFKIQSTYLDGTNLPDTDFIADNFSDYYNNYGLNLQFSAKCDLTPFITTQEDLIAEAKSLRMAYLMLRDIAFSTRTGNNVANQIKEMARKEIYEFDGVRGNVVYRLNQSLDALGFDLSGLDEACLARRDSISVDYSSV